jgi:error-prone DNA polymerase
VPLPLPMALDHVALAPTSAWERMAEEYRVLGLSSHQHPLGLLRPRLPQGMVSSRELETLPHGLLVRVPGLVVCRQRPATAKGITFLLLEDEHGLVNVIVYPDLYERQRHHVRTTPLLIVEGRLQRLHNNLNVLATNLRPLEDGDHALPLPPAGGGDEQPTEEADPRTVQLASPRAGEGDTRRRDDRVDLHAIAPEAHNYR